MLSRHGLARQKSMRDDTAATTIFPFNNARPRQTLVARDAPRQSPTERL
jgi:hypothetical protein